MILKSFHIPRAVQKECTAVNQLLYHVVLTYIGRIVACYEVCLVDQVCRFDRFLTETQVRHGNTTGLLGVIIKVSLSVHICVVTDDLDGVLVSTYSTVSAQSPELAVDGSFRSGNKRSTQSPETDCVTSSTIPMVNFCLLSVVVYSNDLCRSGIFGTKAVTSGEYRSVVELGAL